MASPEASIAGLIAFVIFLFCYLCFKLMQNSATDDRIAEPRITSTRPTTQRITARGPVNSELSTQRNPSVIPIINRKPSPVGWSNSITVDSGGPKVPIRTLEGSLAGTSNRACPYPIDNPTTTDLPYSSSFRKSSAPYPVETTLNKSLPHLPEAAKGSAPYPVESASNDRLPYFSTVTTTSAPYPVETTLNKSLPHLPEAAKGSAPYPVESASNDRLPYFSTVTTTSAPYPVETTLNKYSPHLPEAAKGSAPYPVESASNYRLPYFSTVTSTSAPYPVETTLNKSLPHLPKAAKCSAPYPVESASNNQLPYFPTVSTTSAPYPTDSLAYPAINTQSLAPYPVENSRLTAQMPYPKENIQSEDAEERQKMPHSFKVIHNVAPYPIEQQLEGLLSNVSTLVEPSAPPAQDNTNKILPYPLEIGQNSAPYPDDEPLNKDLPFHTEVNRSFLNNQGLPYADKRTENTDQPVPMKYMDEKTESEEQMRLLEPKEQSQPQTLNREEKCLAEDRRPDTNISEENDQLVDTFRIGFVKPPEPGFKVTSMARGPTTLAVGSYGASGPRGLSSGSKKKSK